MKPSSDYFKPATRMLEEGEKYKNLKIMDDVAGGAATSSKIREKVRKV